jgi:hypothetical protein
VRGGVTAAYATRLAPTEPGLRDLLLSLPVMDTTRLRDQLGWEPRHTSIAALQAFLEALRDPVGGSTPPLEPHAGGPARIGEVATALGQCE